MRAARTALLAAVALLAATALGGCGQLDRWTGAAPAAGPTASSSAAPDPPTASPAGVTAPSRTPTPTPTDTASEEPAETPSPSASASPAPDPVVTAVPEPTPTPTPTPETTKPPEKQDPPPSLRYGDSGTEVRALQHRLVALGYWLGDRDGSFGSLTQQAVFAFQKGAGLERDGVVGPKTRAALEKGVASKPTPRLRGDGIEIDLDRQLLMVVRDGRPSIVLNTSTGSGERYTSSAGNPAIATTPTGTFRVFREVDGQDDSELGELWRPKYFHRGYAVHGSPNIPPYPASHGCARISDAAIDMLWARDLMEIGTTVLVH